MTKIPQGTNPQNASPTSTAKATTPGTEEPALTERPTDPGVISTADTVVETPAVEPKRASAQTAAAKTPAKPLTLPAGLLESESKIKNSKTVRDWLTKNLASEKNKKSVTALLGAFVAKDSRLTTANVSGYYKAMEKQHGEVFDLSLQEDLNNLAKGEKPTLNPVTARNKQAWAMELVKAYDGISNKEEKDASRLIKQVNTLISI